jgi:hypothetical protein
MVFSSFVSIVFAYVCSCRQQSQQTRCHFASGRNGR